MNLSRRNFAALSLGAAVSVVWPVGTESAHAEGHRIPISDHAEEPKKFLWGTSSSAYQTEGNNSNADFWLLEHVKRSIFKEKSGDTCDHYHRYEEDMRLLASLGFNSYRFSVEWARVEPEEGEFSNAELAHYRRVAAACLAAGMAPHLTLHHFSSPLWFARDGGWEREDAPALFARYCGKVAEHLGDLITAACTINEINVPAIIQRHGYFTEKMRAGIRSTVAAKIPATDFSTFLTGEPEVLQRRTIDAHLQARDSFKRVAPNVPLGLNMAIADDQAVDGGEAKLHEYQELCYNTYLDVAKQDDFVGIQTYTRNLVGPEGDRKLSPEARQTQNGWEFYPGALEHTIRYAATRCGRPIYVTENGVATENDGERIEYIREALRGMFRCIQDGIDVRGYYHWSAFDNFEWTEGYRPKFGLIAVDRITFARTIKPSARFLGSIAKQGHLS